MSINTILFDLDGTLVDTLPDFSYALNILLSKYNITNKPAYKIRPFISLGAREIVKFGFGYDDMHPDIDAKHKEILAIYIANVSRNSKIFSGIDKVLNAIKNKNMFWGIVTNKPEKMAHLLIKKLKLKPDVVVCSDTLEHKKPHPAPLLYACNKLLVLPENCLFVGDDISDIVAGKRANIKTIVANYGYSEVKKSWDYDYLINKPLELLRFINGNN